MGKVVALHTDLFISCTLHVMVLKSSNLLHICSQSHQNQFQHGMHGRIRSCTRLRFYLVPDRNVGGLARPWVDSVHRGPVSLRPAIELGRRDVVANAEDAELVVQVRNGPVVRVGEAADSVTKVIVTRPGRLLAVGPGDAVAGVLQPLAIDDERGVDAGLWVSRIVGSDLLCARGVCGIALVVP